MADFDSIIQALPGLTGEQRQQIAARCSALGVEESPGRMDPAVLLWRGFQRAAEDRNELLLPVEMAAKASGWPRLRTFAKMLDDWVESSFRPEDETERVHAYRIVADCVVRRMLLRDVALVVPAFFTFATQATQAVEDQFPGYAASGALRDFVLLG